jgi:hypothetical protein
MAAVKMPEDYISQARKYATANAPKAAFILADARSAAGLKCGQQQTRGTGQTLLFLGMASLK